MKRYATCFIFVTIFLSACSSLPSGNAVSTPFVMTAEVSTTIADGGGAEPILSPEPPTAIPTLASGLSTTELKYRVLDKFPDFFFCDPDFYPIAREDEAGLARQRFPELQADRDAFQVILAHNGLSGSTTFTDDQKLLIYREYKKLNAIYFELQGNKYQFQIQTGADGQQGSTITATINGNGSIDILKSEQSFPNCPICLAAGTLIHTPRGAVSVEELKIGDPVWTMNEAGERVSSIILRTGNTRVPASHQMVHVLLEDGRELWASPGHPTADGRTMQELTVGDMLDGAHIVLLERVHYDGNTTFDLLPSGDTGFYWANGILIGSTLNMK